MMYAFITILSAGVLVAVDQLIKLWATANLAPVGAMPLIPGVVELRYVLNEGAAFSMLSGKQGFLIAFTGIALAALLGYMLYKRPARTLEYCSMLFILAGGVGNLIDRILHQKVVDYINLLFMDFAVFNFADILVCVGFGLLILDMILDEVKKDKEKKSEGSEGGTV